MKAALGWLQGLGHGGRTRVARGGLDDGVTGFKDAGPLRVLHHAQADPILHAAAGIEVLAFCHCRRQRKKHIRKEREREKVV